jgi:hypothetical protein
MGELWTIAIPVLILFVAIFIIKKIVKVTLRLVLLAILALAGFLYMNGNLNLPF